MPVSPGPDFSCDHNAARESLDILQRANIICSLRNLGLGKEIEAVSSYVPFPLTCGSPKSCFCGR